MLFFLRDRPREQCIHTVDRRRGVNMGQRPLLPNHDRRKFLRRLGVGAAAALLGGDRFRLIPDGATALAAMPSCIVRPEQTEGPYFLDEKLDRSDIRSDTADGSVKPGLPLRLTFEVSRVDGVLCAPLPGAIVDVWQCDALGVYSGVRDIGGRFDTSGQRFLRGFQITNVRGIAEFLTIYPGWYPGRAVHIHFKIRRAFQGARAREFTSQLYFDESVNDRVFKEAPYNSHRSRRVGNDSDFIFRRGGKELLLTPMKTPQGYAATFAIGLQFA
jgi:protocatechuate 3,4-dioxygenase beta subunit